MSLRPNSGAAIHLHQPAMPMRRALILLATLLSPLATRPLQAQAPADTAGLARAVASTFATMILLDTRPPSTIVWRHAGTPMDSAVAALLIADPRVRVRTEGLVTAENLTIYRTVVNGDSAIVRLVVDKQYSVSGRSHEITGYNDNSDFFFRRTSTGWRFVRRGFVSHGVTGVVRDSDGG
jgi:hypothetical protein